MTAISNIMVQHVVTVHLDDELSLLETLLETRGFKHLPVVDEDKTLVGIISDRDLRDQLSPFLHTPGETRRDEALLHRHAHQIMTRNPITASPDDDIDYAARLMLFNGISAIPVTDEHGQLLGIMTREDLLCHYTRSR